MTPIRFSIKDGVTHFHYKADELIKFVRLGFKHGDVGIILVRRTGNILTYKGFGTIDNPIMHLQTISIVHHPLFGGEMPTDEQRLVPPEKPEFGFKTLSIDQGKINPLKL